MNFSTFQSEQDNIIEKQKLDIKKLAYYIKYSNNKHALEIDNLNKEIKTKSEEIENLKVQQQNLEKSSNDIIKKFTNCKFSDIIEIQNQHDKDISKYKQLIKLHKNTINEKNLEIEKFSEEIFNLRNLLEQEKKKSEFFFINFKSKLDLTPKEEDLNKLNLQIFSLKAQLLFYQKTIEKNIIQIQNIKNEYSQTTKNLNEIIENLNKELNSKENSYTKLINDYKNTLDILNTTQEEFNKLKFINNKLDSDYFELEHKYNSEETEKIILKSENENLKTRIRGKDSEISNINKMLENSESKILDIKLSKQIFKVRYIYLTMAMEGVLIMKKDELDNEYYFIIENVLTTRKYSFLNVDLRRDFVDDTKIYIRFLKDDIPEEEYYHKDANKIIEFFECFRIKTIEKINFSKEKNNFKNKNNSNYYNEDDEDNSTNNTEIILIEDKIKSLFEF